MFASPPSFPAVQALLADKSVSLTTVLLEPTVLPAFQQCDVELVQYLVLHLGDFLTAALSTTESDANAIARRLWLRLPIPFALRVALSPTVISTLSSFLASSPFSDLRLACYLFQHFAKLSGGCFLLIIPDPITVFQRLFDRLSLPPVRDLLGYVLADGHPDFAEFLDRTMMARVVWERYTASQSPVFLLFLAYIVNSVQAHSFCMQFVSERERLAAIFALATGAGDRETCNYAMEVVYELCSHCNDEDDSPTSILARVFHFVIAHADALARFVGEDGLFCRAKVRAIELLGAVVAAEAAVPDSVLRAAGSLFRQTLRAPTFSYLHVAAVMIFRIIADGGGDIEKMDAEFQIRNAIVEKFAVRDPNAMYYGHLAKIVEAMVQCGGGDAEWREFIEKSFAEVRTRMSGRYGGSHPVKGSSRIVGSDDEGRRWQEVR